MSRRILPVLLVAVLGGSVALAAEPQVEWPAALPGVPTARNPQPANLPGCKQIRIACIDAGLARLKQLQASLGCDHRDVFATTYVVMTQTTRKALVTHKPVAFRYPKWIIAIDVLFHEYYFQAVRDRDAGRTVPGAWRIAFDVAAQGDANATKDLLLGVNAHVQRDLPFVLATLGLHTQSGKSRKRDWDAFNKVLDGAYAPIVDTISARFDPSLRYTNPNTVIDGAAAGQLFRLWRERAFRRAEALLNTRSQAGRLAIRRAIEASTTATAQKIAALPEAPGYRFQRDAYCATNNA
jgi:hypothetical protein